MIADELLNPLLPALKPSDSAGKALDWMDEFRLGQLAVVDGGQYQGLLSEETLLQHDVDALVEDIQPQYAGVFVRDDQHLFEVLQLAQTYSLHLVPVVNQLGLFVGSITRQELLAHFADALGTQETGAVLLLSLDERDYSMAEVSRLVESNNTKIIGSYFGTRPNEPGSGGQLTLKLNRRDVNTVVATLERFGYTVETAFASDPLETPDRERLDALFRFLDI